MPPGPDGRGESETLPMSAAPPTAASPAQGAAPSSAPEAVDVSSRLAFYRNLQAVTTRIHATSNIDEIMLDLSRDISTVFNADRLTLYAVSDDGTAIVSKVKTGLNAFSDIRLPIGDDSIAGYVALTKNVLNVCDVYDDAELAAVSPDLHFRKEVDQRSGYHSKQMLVAPIIEAASGDLLGVVQLINNRAGGPFSAFAQEGVQILAQTLSVAYAQRSKPPAIGRSKYEFLVADSVISSAEFDLATRTSRKKRMDLEEVLIRELQVPISAIGTALAKFFGVPYEPYRADRIKPLDLLRNLKRDYVEQNRWLPIEETKEGMIILTVDPEQIHSSHVVANVFPRSRPSYWVTTSREFNQTIDQFFGPMADNVSVDELLSDLGEDDELDLSAEDISAAADNELVRLVNRIVIDAHQQGASDIHIEPEPGKAKTLVRFRKDGTLVPYIEVPASYRNAMVARIKIMADLDISERRKPQDGKIKFRKFGPLDIELRVATLPSAGGVEDIVMRVIGMGEVRPLDRLGILAPNLERLHQIITKPYGLIFVCGPTGSGKTTTLHSILAHINTPEAKIWTAEDPVEITQKGLRQVQVNRKAGLDFAAAMRAFLRADPDVIMVGEMRDRETMAIGIEASLTGHLVFATLHTNSAAESVARLLDMGMDPYNFADALLGILAQRLAKRLCENCKEPRFASEDEVRSLLEEYCLDLGGTPAFAEDPQLARAAIFKAWLEHHADDQGRFTLCRPVGCLECNNLGYRGRVGLHELLVASDRTKRLIHERARAADLLGCGLDEGMRTLKMDGIEKVLAGQTDMKQIRAVCLR
jgi:type II secretory ATPase GspE/PulE/Tfp pilus assembly ATPase PilB-like protein